jgi:hypothetical protein
MKEPKRIWWARPRKLCALERPGGGGRSHRPARRQDEIEWLKANGVHTVVSTMRSRHNLAAYEAAGLRWHHVPVDDMADADEQLEEVLRVLRRELRRAGAVAVHGDRRTDFVAAACAACLADYYDLPLELSLERAVEAGLTVTDDAIALVGADFRMALR